MQGTHTFDISECLFIVYLVAERNSFDIFICITSYFTVILYVVIRQKLDRGGLVSFSTPICLRTVALFITRSRSRSLAEQAKKSDAEVKHTWPTFMTSGIVIDYQLYLIKTIQIGLLDIGNAHV